METAEDARKQWASMLTGQGSMPQAAIGSWLRLAALAMGAASVAGGANEGDQSAGPSPTPVGMNWAAAAGPMFTSWTSTLDNLQGSPFAWLLAPAENPLARLMSHPAAAVGGENSQGRLSANVATAMLEFMQAAMSHQALQAHGWKKAMERFTSEFAPDAPAGDHPVVVETLDDLLGHWGVVGEAAVQEHSRSEPFLRSQAEMLRKAMRYRIASRAALESTLRANDLPTLTDLDEAFAAIHSLRGDIREVRKLAQSALAAATATRKPVAATKRRSPPAAEAANPESKPATGKKARSARRSV